jgi:hypothetical protein
MKNMMDTSFLIRPINKSGIMKGKGKAIQLQSLTGPEGSRRLRKRKRK